MYQQIIDNYCEIRNIHQAMSLLNWDQSTIMPQAGVESRSEILYTLSRIAHEKATDPYYYELLQKCLHSSEFSEYTPLQQIEVKKLLRDIEKQKKIPADLAAEMSRLTSVAMNAWEEARRTGDDARYLPLLTQIFALKSEMITHLGYSDDPYDALLDEYDEGLTWAQISPLFDRLKTHLTGFLDKILNSGKSIRDDFLYGTYDIRKQWNFGTDVLTRLKIDMNAFRQDLSAHPFTTTIGAKDVRITTNLTEKNFSKGFFSTIHEAGHALYELGVHREFSHSPCENIESLSLHESQSRLYENLIGLSLPFWKSHFTLLKNYFTEELWGVTLDQFYQGINKVSMSPIRIDSDEISYNLHILLRTRLEHDIIGGKVAIADIHEVWNETTHDILGFYPESKSTGYLQDIHWSDGLIGYFPTYTMGNIISAQFYHSIENDLGRITDVNEEVLAGIQQWLRDKLYVKGSMFSAGETVLQITGEPINIQYFIDYLMNKYQNIYSF
jgi:carboxypeptidase Taq